MINELYAHIVLSIFLINGSLKTYIVINKNFYDQIVPYLEKKIV